MSTVTSGRMFTLGEKDSGETSVKTNARIDQFVVKRVDVKDTGRRVIKKQKLV